MIKVWMDNEPDGGYTKTFVGASGWREGLPIVTEDWANGTSGAERKRWSWTDYTQDNTLKSYILNPRVTQSKIGDTGNVKRTEIDYRLLPNTNIAEYGLVSEVRLFDNGTNVLQKRSTTAYNLSNDYVSRRIIGLPSMVENWGLNQATNSPEYVSKATFNYDEGDFNDSTLEQNISLVIQHDTANYGSGFITGRGNLTSQTRHDVTGQTANVTSSTKYNITGAPVAQIDPLGRTVKISYADVFNDTPSNRNTFAYPTKLTDMAGNFSEVKYRYDIGANVWAKSPAPAGNTTGKETVREFDLIGRLQKETLVNTGAYTRYEYPTNNIQSKVFSTVIDTNNNGADSADEVYAESWTDGGGRVRKARTEHPNSSGGWTGSLTEYDILGRVTRSTVPTEINASYEPAGDDATRGWLWKYQKYDWKGRVTRIINTDGTDSPTLNDSDQLFSYEGCGCAGGQITTIQGELVPRDDQSGNARRTQKVYQDILGRDYKTEVLNWDNSVYTTAVTKFNGRDQVLDTIQYAGTVSSSVFQTTTATYDGHGRMKTRRLPQQTANTVTNYNADDSVSSVTDARGAITNYDYNGRGLLEEISYEVPANSNIPVPSDVNFSYDAVGNRTQMTDGLGNVVYEYNQLSQMTAETRQFNDTLADAPLSNNKFKIQYTYHLGGSLKSVTDPYNVTINYGNDKIGRLQSVTGTSFAGLTTYAENAGYRAFGALKSLTYGNGVQMQTSFNNRLQADSFDLSKNNVSKIRKNYEFYADGGLKYIEDELNDKFDRLNRYDHSGRLTQAKSGAEARGGSVTNQQDQQTSLPYRQSFGYNAFNNLTERNNLNWGTDSWYGESFNQTYTYQNNRITNSGFQYDADGRNTVSSDYETVTTTYDAAGQMAEIIKAIPALPGYNDDIYFYRDGNGQMIKRLQKDYLEQEYPATGYHWVDRPMQYFIRSTVFGGEVLTEVNNTGKKLRTYIKAQGATLGWQTLHYPTSGSPVEETRFEHSDISGTNRRMSKADGTVITTTTGLEDSPAEFDTTGNSVGVENPYPEMNPQPNGEGCIGCGSSGIIGIDDNSSLYVHGKRMRLKVDGIAVNLNQYISHQNLIEENAFYGSSILGLMPRDSQLFEEFKDGEWLNLDRDYWRQLDKSEVNLLKAELGKVVSNKECATFINELLTKAKELGPKNFNTYANFYTANILDIFDSVVKYGGIFTGRFGSSTIRGTILYGQPDPGNEGKIYNVESDRPKVLLSNLYYYPRNDQDPLYKEFKNVRNGRTGTLIDINKAALFDPARGVMTLLHELIHFNYHDVYLANAVRALNEDEETAKFSFLSADATDEERIKETERASKYWNKELHKNCNPLLKTP